MDEIRFWIIVGVLVAGFGLLGWLLLRLRRRLPEEGLARRLAELERTLGESFTRANLDMAARVEELKGDLRTDLSERLQTGLLRVREAVDRQIAAGRMEQEKSFQSSRLELTASLSRLSDGLRVTFERMTERQAQTARQSRSELSETLTRTTQALQQRLETLEQRTTRNLETIRSKVDEKLGAISEQVQAKLEKNIQEGFAHFEKVQEHLKAAEEQLRNVGAVGTSINELNTLLKLPHLRGRFGEAELGRLLADFLPAASFEEQVAVVPGSRELVDALVKFPRYRLPIDSKFNREQILPLFETSDPRSLEEARRQLATTIKQQARSIKEKYVHPEHGTTDLALMFLPSETIYFEVIRDGALLEALHKASVFPVSPNTLAITLRAIAMSVSQYEFAKGVEKTLNQIKAARRSFGFFEQRFEEVGKGIQKAQEAYQTATGHLSRYADRVVRLTGEPPPEIEAAPAQPEPVAPDEPDRESTG